MSESFSTGRRQFLKGATAAALTPLFAANLEAQDNPASTLYIQPYLQNPTADGMTICFAALGVAGARVRWGSSKKALTRTADMASLPISKVTWRVWKARLSDLKPKQTYYYQVDYNEDGAKKSSEVYTFTPFDPAATDIRAVIYNDVHSKIALPEALTQWVKPEDFTFSILLGDMWHDPSLSNNGLDAFRILEAYVRLFDGSNKPMMFVRGNHDVRGYFYSRLSHLFDFPLNDPAATFADQNAYYDFRVGPVWFIAPDSGEDGSKRLTTFTPYRERQVKWLDSIFNDSPHQQAPWRVLTTHIPLYYKGYWEAELARELWTPSLAKGKIDVGISGHIHAWAVIPKDKEVVHLDNKGKPDERTIRYTPLFPTFIGGGRSMPTATVTFLTADAQTLDLRALNVRGEIVQKISLDKHLPS